MLKKLIIRKQINYDEKQKGFAHLFLIVIIVIIGIAGLLYFSWQKGSIKTTTQEAFPTPTEIDEAASQTPNGNLTNWKTYTSTNLGIAFKHPVDAQIKDDSFGIEIKDSGGPLPLGFNPPCEMCYYILVDREKLGGVSFKEYFENSFNIKDGYVYLNSLDSGMGIKINKYEEFEIDGKPALRVIGGPEHKGIPDDILRELDPSDMGFDEVHILITENEIITIGNKRPHHIYKQKENIFDQILSTLRFLE